MDFIRAGGGGWVCSLSVSCEILLATSQDTDLTSYTCYICLFPQPEKISFPALISQHFPLCIRLTVALWSPLPSSEASSLPPLPWVTIVFELPFPLLHLVTVSFDLLLALCEGGNLSSQTDGNLTKSSTASRSLLHPCCPYESSANASWSCSDPPRELRGLLPFWLLAWWAMERYTSAPQTGSTLRMATSVAGVHCFFDLVLADKAVFLESFLPLL